VCPHLLERAEAGTSSAPGPVGSQPVPESGRPNTMQVIRGTRAPFLAAACALLLIGAGTADSPIAVPYEVVYFTSLVPIVGGVDGCPAFAGSTFDPRSLCAADLGISWNPVAARGLHLCPPGPSVEDVVLSSGPITVSEDITAKLTAAAATAFAANVTTSDCAADVAFAGEPRKTAPEAIAGTTFDAQSARSFPRGGGGIFTAMAIGNDVLTVGVSDDELAPDNATVVRIVKAAVHRFQNPRPSGGPFTPTTTTTVVSPTP
jgi:hypothetical protein